MFRQYLLFKISARKIEYITMGINWNYIGIYKNYFGISDSMTKFKASHSLFTNLIHSKQFELVN